MGYLANKSGPITNEVIFRIRNAKFVLSKIPISGLISRMCVPQHRNFLCISHPSPAIDSEENRVGRPRAGRSEGNSRGQRRREFQVLSQQQHFVLECEME